jgi:MoaA/NifB/PqqE/SkfB family radical SAM enzyme
MERELSLEEIEMIVDEARGMGCRRWSISGGEPMLRPDFEEIFDYITSRSVSYSLNTNGSLITPRIARRLTRKGSKMVALYGATAGVHDHITRKPGSFEATLQGFAYLKEAGAGFIVQLVPMRDNYHELEKMVELAASLSPHWRFGAAWLYLSASGDRKKNEEIRRQRLSPEEVVEIDKPDVPYNEWREGVVEHPTCVVKSPMSKVQCATSDIQHPTLSEHPPSDHAYCRSGNDRLFASCIAARRDFHIDPYGRMSFCCFVKDPALRYDLRRGTFKECWEEFIPSLADRVRGGEEYRENCASCELRDDCRWCPVYGYLEHGRFPARVGYLCEVAKKSRAYKESWRKNHRRYYRIGGITIQVDADLPILDTTFHPKFRQFEVNGPGEDTIFIRHHFSIPDLNGKNLGKELYRRPPWAISRQNDSYVYLGISPQGDDPRLHRMATFSADHTRARIYSDEVRRDAWRKGDLHSLTLFPSDQILIARLLADRQGCYLHSAGAIINGAGVLFVGHSEAGKSTITELLIDAPVGANDHSPLQVEILCDDRNIVRRRDDGWYVYGTWSHGDVPAVSANDAPLRAICFIEKATENTLRPLTDRKEITRRLLGCVIKPFVTADWWHKTLDLIEALAQEATCYVVRFDKTGEIVEQIRGQMG